MSETIYKKDYTTSEGKEGIPFPLRMNPLPPRKLVPYAEENLSTLKDICDNLAIRFNGSVEVVMEEEKRKVSITLRVPILVLMDGYLLRDLDYKVSYLCMYIEDDMAVFQIDVRYFA